MDLKDIQRQIDQEMFEQNNRSVPEFEGYSPQEMHHLLHFTFEKNSPISLKKLEDYDYLKIPMLNQIKYFLDLVQKSGEIKLTAKGFLPTKIVKDIYDQGYLEDMRFGAGLFKLYKESDSVTVNLTRILAELAGLTKKRKGKLSLTKKGKKISSDNSELFELIFKTITRKFNWAYYDGYGENYIVQFGFGFSLVLLHIYGSTKRKNSFYAEKYFTAFPLIDEVDSTYDFDTAKENAYRCYSFRTFERFLGYFGLVTIETIGEPWSSDKYITKTGLYDKLIEVQPHRSTNHHPLGIRKN